MNIRHALFALALINGIIRPAEAQSVPYITGNWVMATYGGEDGMTQCSTWDNIFARNGRKSEISSYGALSHSDLAPA